MATLDYNYKPITLGSTSDATTSLSTAGAFFNSAMEHFQGAAKSVIKDNTQASINSLKAYTNDPDALQGAARQAQTANGYIDMDAFNKALSEQSKVVDTNVYRQHAREDAQHQFDVNVALKNAQMMQTGEHNKFVDALARKQLNEEMRQYDTTQMFKQKTQQAKALQNQISQWNNQLAMRVAAGQGNSPEVQAIRAQLEQARVTYSNLVGLPLGKSLTFPSNPVQQDTSVPADTGNTPKQEALIAAINGITQMVPSEQSVDNLQGVPTSNNSTFRGVPYNLPSDAPTQVAPFAALGKSTPYNEGLTPIKKPIDSLQDSNTPFPKLPNTELPKGTDGVFNRESSWGSIPKATDYSQATKTTFYDNQQQRLTEVTNNIEDYKTAATNATYQALVQQYVNKGVNLNSQQLQSLQDEAQKATEAQLSTDTKYHRLLQQQTYAKTKVEDYDKRLRAYADPEAKRNMQYRVNQFSIPGADSKSMQNIRIMMATLGNSGVLPRKMVVEAIAKSKEKGATTYSLKGTMKNIIAALSASANDNYYGDMGYNAVIGKMKHELSTIDLDDPKQVAGVFKIYSPQINRISVANHLNSKK